MTTFSIFGQIKHSTTLRLNDYQKSLTLSCKMLKNGQTYFKYFVLQTPQDFKSMFGRFQNNAWMG